MGIAGDVLVQVVHELPAALLAPHLQPARDVEEAGARRVGVGHDHMALVDGLGQVLPRARQGQVVLLRLHGVVTDGRDPGPLTDPQRRFVGGINIGLVQLVHALRGVALEIALVGQQHQAGRGQAPHDVGPGIGLLGEQLGGDDAGGIADPFDIYIRVVLLELPLEHCQLVGLDGGVDKQVRLGHGGPTGKAKGEERHGHGRREPFQQIGSHEICLHLPGKRCTGGCLAWLAVDGTSLSDRFLPCGWRARDRSRTRAGEHCSTEIGDLP